MERIDKPTDKLSIVFDSCIKRMLLINRIKYSAAKKILMEYENQYDTRANMHMLSDINRKDKIDVVSAGIPYSLDKKDMRYLYESRFRDARDKVGDYYDNILRLAKHDMCPYCGAHIVNTIDHYLPQSNYPQFSVTPINLIPSCSRCNTAKKEYYPVDYEGEIFHPYYDYVGDFIWLKAKMVIKINPYDTIISFIFVADPPVVINPRLRERVKKSFEILELNDTFKSNAYTDYVGMEKTMIRQFYSGGKACCINFLKSTIHDERLVNKNSIKAAIYQAMIDNDWYWEDYIPNLK